MIKLKRLSQQSPWVWKDSKQWRVTTNSNLRKCVLNLPFCVGHVNHNSFLTFFYIYFNIFCMKSDFFFLSWKEKKRVFEEEEGGGGALSTSPEFCSLPQSTTTTWRKKKVSAFSFLQSVSIVSVRVFAPRRPAACFSFPFETRLHFAF